MATTPEHLGQLKDTTEETPLTTDLRGDLRELAAREADHEHPYLTVTLDYRPDGNRPNMRIGMQWLDEQERLLREQYGPRGPEYDALVEGLASLRDILGAIEDPQPQGVIAVMQPGADFSLVLPLSVAPESRIGVRPTPDLFEIARVQDVAEPFAVLLADSKQAFLHVFALGAREHDVEMHGGPRIGKVHPGAKSAGFGERNALNAAEQQLENFAKSIAEATRDALANEKVNRLIVMADAQLTSTLMEHFPREISDLVIGTAHADIRSTPDMLYELALPIVQEAERQQEDDLCRELETAALSAQAYGVYGAAGTLAALQAGQVQTLIVAEDFTAPAWVDDTFAIIGLGTVPTEHPAGGDVADLREADAREEFVRLALMMGADGVEFVPLIDDAPVTETVNEAEAANAGARGGAVARLRDEGGVGALLRFALAPDQAVPDVE